MQSARLCMYIYIYIHTHPYALPYNAASDSSIYECIYLYMHMYTHVHLRPDLALACCFGVLHPMPAVPVPRVRQLALLAFPLLFSCQQLTAVRQLAAFFAAVDGDMAVGDPFFFFFFFSFCIFPRELGAVRQWASFFQQLTAVFGSWRARSKISKSASCPLHGRAVGSIFVWDAAQFDICHTKVVKMKTFFRN